MSIFLTLQLLVESNPRDEEVGNDDDKLRDIARDNAQILLNSLWRLPTHRVEDALVAALPPPQTQLVVLPREKPAPKPRQPTKVRSDHIFKSVLRNCTS